MRFFEVLERQDWRALRELAHCADRTRAQNALSREQRGLADFAALVSPNATGLIQEMARAATALTIQHFGRTIGIYAPLYVSNVCTNLCRYCHYRAGQPVPRITLSAEQVEFEARELHGRGFRHVLLVSGEAPAELNPPILATYVSRVAALFPSVSLETYPQTVDGYASLVASGAEGLALYQETYDRSTYQWAHPAGAKADYRWRIDGLDRAGEAGLPKLGLGVLLGLHDWRDDALHLVAHARHLMHRHWRSQVMVSLPRLRAGPEGFVPPWPVNDADLVQLLVSLRLVLPDTAIALSTREPATVRNALISLGVTQMSAGSRTEPGGYCSPCEKASQFEVLDRRSPAQVAEAIRLYGYDPVWKDSYSLF